jgi:hypothetical protein
MRQPKYKVAKVLAFYFGDRRNYPHNKQEVIELFKRQIQAHRDYNPKVSMDLIIVNHDNEDQEVYDLLKEYEGQKVSRGKIKIIHRPRISSDLSFGSFKYAFFLLQNEYDYWFFSEDDVVPIKSGVIPELIKVLNSNEDVGFVGAVNLPSPSDYIISEEGYINSDHIHGGIGLTSTKKMKQVAEVVPEYLQTPNILNQEKTNEQVFSYSNDQGHEISFTKDFIKAGFKLKVIPPTENFFDIRKNVKA